MGLAFFAAATPASAANADCFCARASGNSGKPYEVVRLKKKACADVPYKSNGKPPWQNGVPTCPDSVRTRSSAPSSPKAKDELMRRCFCHKLDDGGGIKRFKVVSCSTVPECKGLKYQEKAMGPWENTLTCGHAENCKASMKRCKKDLDKLTKQLTDKDPNKVMRAQNEIVNVSKRCHAIEDGCYINPQK